MQYLMFYFILFFFPNRSADSTVYWSVKFLLLSCYWWKPHTFCGCFTWKAFQCEAAAGSAALVVTQGDLWLLVSWLDEAAANHIISFDGGCLQYAWRRDLTCTDVWRWWNVVNSKNIPITVLIKSNYRVQNAYWKKNTHLTQTDVY